MIISTLFIQVFSNNCYAVDPEEFLHDPQQELRARNISKNIRCMVCQNQSIDESASTLAKDLRIKKKKKITEGLSDKEIYKFLTDRYGDFILLNPSFKINTYVLWFFPFIIFIIGTIVFYWYYKKSSV